MIKTIAFHSNQLSIRGTEVAMYDYADFFERIYGGRAIILTPKDSPLHDLRSASRFAERFTLLPYQSAPELDQILKRENAELLYCIKAGFDDGLRSNVCRTVVHAVFPHYEPHGDIYAYVSAWLSKDMQTSNNQENEIPFVPHIVQPLPRVDTNLRMELGIASNATVFGRYGGPESFDIPFVRELIPLIVRQRADLIFLFANTDRFCDPHPQIIHLEGTSDLEQKARLVQSCDAMIHARERGETFGMATAEFATSNRPVFTWSNSKELAHLEHLGHRAVLYNNAEDLAIKLLSFVPQLANGNCPYLEFTPQSVMEKFISVFVSS